MPGASNVMRQRLLRAALSTAIAATATAQEAPVDTIPWTPLNQLTITAPVRLDGMRGDTIRLTYSVQSHPTSVQAGRSVFLRRNTTIWVVGSPRLWSGSPELVQDSAAVIWFTFNAETRIKPGESVEGFAVAGVGVPDFVTLRVRGHVPIPVGEESENVEYAEPPSIWVDAAEALTVGIVPKPVATSSGMLDRLSTLSSRACELAWVAPGSICSSLTARLSDASTALARGQKRTARSEIDAYIADLEASRGGAVSESAYALLWPNAKTLRARL